jgi:hypothetical protein
MTAWLDENCGADGWAMTPSGTRGVLYDAASIYFLDTTLAGAFVARWCAGYRVETAGGVFQVRDDDPAPRVGAGLHWTQWRNVGIDAPLRAGIACGADSQLPCSLRPGCRRTGSAGALFR